MRARKLLSLSLVLILMLSLVSCISITTIEDSTSDITQSVHTSAKSAEPHQTETSVSADTSNSPPGTDTAGTDTSSADTTDTPNTDTPTTDTPTTDTPETDTTEVETDKPEVETDTPETDKPDTDTDDTTPPSPPVYATENEGTRDIVGISSANAILIDLQTYTVLARKGAEVRINPASMTKILTILVAVEHIESLEQTATVTRKTVDHCYLEGASVVGFKANETVTVRDLLYGTILPSGADAALTLAECIAGSEAEFAKLMNQKAAELGLVGSHFVTVTGLYHPEHYSTVHDIAVILKAALENDICKEILSATDYQTSKTNKSPNGIYLESIVHTRLSGTSVPGLTILGGKTGYLPEAGYCLATYATSDDGRMYILVTAGAPNNKKQPISDAAHVYKEYVR